MVAAPKIFPRVMEIREIGHQDFFKKTEFAVPDGGNGREKRHAHYAHGNNAGIHKLDEIHSKIAAGQRASQTCAKNN